jgi:hypothetical protein
VNKLKQDFSFDLFNKTFGKCGAVWTITLLHAIMPLDYPIYDQHAYRAYWFIETGQVLKKEGLPIAIKTVYKAYETYCPFFHRFSKEADQFTTKQVDETLWGFGKFLSQNPKFFQV